jgi:hypothetical protein
MLVERCAPTAGGAVSSQCSLCRVEFRLDEGGACSSCGRLFCGIDLLSTSEKPPRYVCKSDLPAAVKARPMLAWFKRGSLRARRAIRRGTL